MHPSPPDAHHLLHTTAAGNLSIRHHPPPNNSSLLFDYYSCEGFRIKDSSAAQPVRSPSSSSAAASLNHKEAEKRRRERINSHLNRLRTLLPCNSKTDKASLLAKVIQRLKELKQEASAIEHLENLPSETDEITVMSFNGDPGVGKVVMKVSLCCEDRSDLLLGVLQTLKSLRMSPLRVETVAFGGRIRNIVLAECDGPRDDSVELARCLKHALGSLVRSNLGSNPSMKRQRTFVCA